jgi:hypothetical protein
VAQLFAQGDDEQKRAMVLAIRDTGMIEMGMHEGRWRVRFALMMGSNPGPVDLGNGMCFLRTESNAIVKAIAALGMAA